MSKKLKMVIYGEPGVGKSTFAASAPKPFFITTDGNYEWLDRPEEDHIQVSSWSECKDAFSKSYDNYDTIVVDLVEDAFKWVEYEYCKRNKFDHVSDAGYGKGFDITRNEFFIEIGKLLAKDKNIILISHGLTTIVKDRRGVEHNKYVPSNRIPDKVWDMIEGRVRYFLRCYLKAETLEDDIIVKRRYLSLVPKENEFGIARGINEDSTPHDIDLNFNTFARAIDFENDTQKPGIAASIGLAEDATPKRKHVKKTTEEKEQQTKTYSESAEEKPNTVVSEVNEDVSKADSLPWEDKKAEEKEVKEKPVEPEKEVKEMSNAEKIAMIKAKLAAKKK